MPSAPALINNPGEQLCLSWLAQVNSRSSSPEERWACPPAEQPPSCSLPMLVTWSVLLYPGVTVAWLAFGEQASFLGHLVPQLLSLEVRRFLPHLCTHSPNPTVSVLLLEHHGKQLHGFHFIVTKRVDVGGQRPHFFRFSL